MLTVDRLSLVGFAKAADPLCDREPKSPPPELPPLPPTPVDECSEPAIAGESGTSTLESGCGARCDFWSGCMEGFGIGFGVPKGDSRCLGGRTLSTEGCLRRLCSRRERRFKGLPWLVASRLKSASDRLKGDAIFTLAPETSVRGWW